MPTSKKPRTKRTAAKKTPAKKVAVKRAAAEKKPVEVKREAVTVHISVRGATAPKVVKTKMYSGVDSAVAAYRSIIENAAAIGKAPAWIKKAYMVTAFDALGRAKTWVRV